MSYKPTSKISKITVPCCEFKLSSTWETILRRKIKMPNSPQKSKKKEKLSSKIGLNWSSGTLDLEELPRERLQVRFYRCKKGFKDRSSLMVWCGLNRLNWKIMFLLKAAMERQVVKLMRLRRVVVMRDRIHNLMKTILRSMMEKWWVLKRLRTNSSRLVRKWNHRKT